MTSRPLYVPHDGHARCASLGALHCGQGWVWGVSTFQCAARWWVRERDIFFFGTAMSEPFRHSGLRSGFQQVTQRGKRGIDLLVMPRARTRIQVASAASAKSPAVGTAGGHHRQAEQDQVPDDRFEVDDLSVEGVSVGISFESEHFGEAERDQFGPFGETPVAG